MTRTAKNVALLVVMLLVVFGAAASLVRTVAGAQELPTVFPGQTLLYSDGGYNVHRCTLGAVGRDSAGRLVGITAGHCDNANVNESILLPNTAGNAPDTAYGAVGSYAFANKSTSLDYAIIVYDETKVRGTAQGPDVRVDAIGNAFVGQAVCKDGSTTNFTCGTVRSLSYLGVYNWIDSSARNQPGDSGGPLVAGNAIVGITIRWYAGFGSWWPARYVSSNIQGILADLNPRGVPGSGFAPLTS